jgi:hypothetical protein
MLNDELPLLVKWSSDCIAALEQSAPPELEVSSVQEARIEMECRRIKKAWTDFLFSQAKDSIVKRYVAFEQQQILEVADKLYLVLESRPAQTSTEEHAWALASLLLKCMLDLRDFQVKYFNAFFDAGGKIPTAAVGQVRKRLSEAAEELSASLESVELDLGLKACLRDYLNSIVTADLSAPLTYQSAEYILSFTENLDVTVMFENDRDVTYAITESLFYMNFNYNGFCQWYQDNLIARKQLVRPADESPFLIKQLLKLKSMPVNTVMSLDPLVPPVNVQLENWLNEYIKQETFQFEVADMEQADKLELKLTVAQMALLIRLLYEEGVFAMKNIAAILKFFSTHFISKKQEHISYGSMNKLYYSGDQFTAYAVRDLLQKMIANINKMFFPT